MPGLEATTLPIHAALGLSTAEVDDAVAWARGRVVELLACLEDAELQALLHPPTAVQGRETASASASRPPPPKPRPPPPTPSPHAALAKRAVPEREDDAPVARTDRTRRRAQRHSLSTPVVVRVDSMPGFLELETRDISLHGIFIESHAPPECHAHIAVRLPFPDGSGVVHLVGEVVRVVTTREAAAVGCAPGFGVSFSAVSDESRRELERLLELARSGAAANAPRPRGPALTQRKTAVHVRSPATKG